MQNALIIVGKTTVIIVLNYQERYCHLQMFVYSFCLLKEGKHHPQPETG